MKPVTYFIKKILGCNPLFYVTGYKYDNSELLNSQQIFEQIRNCFQTKKVPSSRDLYS